VRALTYNGNLTFEPEYAEPVPREGECLLRVRLAGISPTDLHIAHGLSPFRGVLGHEGVAVVERGPDKWRGQRVVCDINCVCRTCDMCLTGLSNHCRQRTVMGMKDRDGCFADRLVMPARNLHGVPEGLTDEEAVFVEPLASAGQMLIQCPVDRRMNVSVIGPGLVGSLAAQLLRSTGCTLTVLGCDPNELDSCEKKGIQTILVDEFVPRQDRDVVVECTGSAEGLAIAAALVRPRGTIVVKSPHVYLDQRTTRPTDRDGGRTDCQTCTPKSATDRPSSWAGPWRSGTCFNPNPLVESEITLIGSRCGPFPQAIDALARGAVDVRSMISRVFDLDDAMDAMAHAGANRHGKTLLRVSS